MTRFLSGLLFALSLGGASAQVCDPTGNLWLLSNYDGGIVTINVDVNIPDLVIGICTYEPVQVTITGPFAGNVSQVFYSGMNSNQNNNNCGQGNFTTTVAGVPPNIVTINPPLQPLQVGYTPAHGNGTSPNWGGGVYGTIGLCDTTVNAGGGNTPDELVFHFEDQTGATLYAHQTQYACWQNDVVSISAGGNCCIDPSPPPPPSANICNANGNLVIYSNYEGGVLTINVDQNIPDLRIGICTYEAVQVSIIGPFAANVTEVIYAGFDGANGPCGTNPTTTTINGVPPGIVTQYSQTLGNIAIANFLGEPLAPGFPPLVNCIVGAEGECSTSNNGGGNSAPQIAQFFLAEFGPDAALFAHQVQYGCFTGTFNVSDGGNCCLLETGTPPNPIYAGNATYDFIPWTDSLLCDGPITIDLSFYPVLFQPPIYPGYVWSDGTTGPIITITEPGTYSFIVGDYCHYEDGNWLTDTVVVLPCCSIGGIDTASTPISCNGASDGSISVLAVGAGPFTYTWDTEPPQATASIADLGPGTYTVVVADASGCDSTLSITLTEPTPLVLDVQGNTPLCSGAEVTITAIASGGTGTAQLDWSPVGSGTSYSFSPAATTTINVTATDANGCSATDALTIEVLPLPTAGFTTSADTLCAGSPVTFTATTAADSLSWDLGSAGITDNTAPVATFFDPGVELITLTAFNAAGCSSLTVVDSVRVAPLVLLSLVAEQPTCDRSITVDLLALGADACGLWLNGVPVASSCIGTLTLPVSGTGSYTLSLAGSNFAGCADTLTTAVTVEDGAGLFVPNVFTPDNNGINDTFGISWVAPGAGFVMRIFNRWGQEIYTSTDPTVEWDGRASGALVPDGVYAYLISAEDPCSPGELRELRGHVTLLR